MVADGTVVKGKDEEAKEKTPYGSNARDTTRPEANE